MKQQSDAEDAGRLGMMMVMIMMMMMCVNSERVSVGR